MVFTPTWDHCKSMINIRVTIVIVNVIVIVMINIWVTIVMIRNLAVHRQRLLYFLVMFLQRLLVLNVIVLKILLMGQIPQDGNFGKNVALF